MENECETLPGVAYPGVRDNRSTLNTKTGYDDMMMADMTATNRLYNKPRATATSSNQEPSGELVTLGSLSLHLVHGIADQQN